jgi:hypothetical protein
MIHAPFNDFAQQRLRDWQECPWTHPLTCSGGNDGATCPSKADAHPGNAQVVLEVSAQGLRCPGCGRLQEWAPDLCLTLPMSPADVLRAANTQTGVPTYAKVNGPPADWQQLRITDLATGLEVEGVVEVNTAEGWLLRHVTDHKGHPILAGEGDDRRIQVERVEGRFAISYQPKDEQS